MRNMGMVAKLQLESIPISISTLRLIILMIYVLCLRVLLVKIKYKFNKNVTNCPVHVDIVSERRFCE